MLFFLIFFTLQLIQPGNNKCTINDQYDLGVTSVNDIELCTNNDCLPGKTSLKHNDVYQRCRYGGITSTTIPRMKIQIYRKESPGSNKPLFCVDKMGTWITITRNIRCESTTTLKFTSYPYLEKYDIYVVACDDNEQEFPDEDNPRIMIRGFDSVQEEKLKDKLLMCPTQKIQCVAICKDDKPTFQALNGSTLITINNNAKIPEFIVNTNKIKGHPSVTVQCTNIQKSVRILSFVIADKITGTLVVPNPPNTRVPPNMYDAGETLSCRGTCSHISFPNHSGPIPNAFLALVQVDTSGNIASKLTNGSHESITIHDNINIQTGEHALLCFYGSYESNNSNEYYQIEKWDITIGARFQTKLMLNGKPISEDLHDFVPGDRIRCDADLYGKMLGTRIIKIEPYILYTQARKFPPSVLSNYYPREWINSSLGEVIFQRKNLNITLLFCVVNSELSTPVQIYSGDRPKVTIRYIHPKWKTEYHLMGFILACSGTNVESMDLSCTNCLPGYPDMEITKIDSAYYKLTIPKNIRRNFEIIYRCYGYSSKYQTATMDIHLKIIVSEITNVYGAHRFFLYGQDVIGCRSYFTIVKEKQNLKQFIELPVQLQIDGSRILNVNGSLKEIMIMKDYDYHIDSNRVMNFQACCPIYVNDEYQCLGQWKTLYVARSYLVKYNIDLNDVYPGNTLKCNLCLNFTFEILSPNCNGIYNVQSEISILVTNPDGSVTKTDYLNEVRAPVEGLKPDGKGYYKITDYDVQVNCKRRDGENFTRIYLKSCNLNPPNIMINPPDKTMFVVGDIFSCTTEAINCKNGLKYAIYLQRGNEQAEKKYLQSFMLTKRHTGNNIKISCVAGEGEISKSSRIIRVEVGPHNVSILTVYPLMVYGQYLRCHALGFPPPTITWNQLRGGSTLRVSENFLLIGPWDFPGVYVVNCEALNKRGSVTVLTTFKIFNPRIAYSDYNFVFYLIVPLLTLSYVLLLLLSLMLIFQEAIFGVPFFSYSSKMSDRPGKMAFHQVVTPKVFQPETIPSILQGDDKST